MWDLQNASRALNMQRRLYPAIYRSVAVCCTCIAGCFGQPIAAEELSPGQLAVIAKRFLVHIHAVLITPNGEAFDAYGTGIIFSSNRHIVTTLHTFTGMAKDQPVQIKSIFVTFGDMVDPATEVSAELIDRSDKSDLALLRARSAGNRSELVPICKRDPNEVIPLLGFGFADKGGLTPAQGLFANDQPPEGQDLYQVSGMGLAHGMSGGPVFDLQGRVRALIKGGIRDTTAVGWVIPIRLANTWLNDQNRVTECDPAYKLVEKSNDLSTTEQITSEIDNISLSLAGNYDASMLDNIMKTGESPNIMRAPKFITTYENNRSAIAKLVLYSIENIANQFHMQRGSSAYKKSFYTDGKDFWDLLEKFGPRWSNKQIADVIKNYIDVCNYLALFDRGDQTRDLALKIYPNNAFVGEIQINFLFDAGLYARALTEVDRNLDMLNVHANEASLGQLQRLKRERAQLFWRLGRYSESKKQYELLLAATETGSQEYAYLRNDMGPLFIETGSVNEALAAYQDAYRIVAGAQSDATFRAIVANNLANAFFEAGDPVQARIYANSSLEEKRQLPIISPVSIAITQINLGRALTALNDDAMAMICFRRAEAIYNELNIFGSNFLTQAASLKVDIGALLFKIGNKEEGLATLRDGLRTLLQTATPGSGLVIANFAVVGQVHVLSGDYIKGCGYVEEGLVKAAESRYGDPGVMALLHGLRGKCLRNAGKMRDAESEWEIARSIVERDIPNATFIQNLSRERFYKEFRL